MATDSETLKRLKNMDERLDRLEHLLGLRQQHGRKQLSAADQKLLDEALAEHQAGKTASLADVHRILERRHHHRPRQ